MGQSVENSREWFTLGLRCLLVLLIPTALMIELSESTIRIYYLCILSGEWPVFVLPSTIDIQLNPVYLLIPILAMIPGILYNYEIGQRPLDSSVKRLTLWALLATFLLNYLQGYLVTLGVLMGAEAWVLATTINQTFPLSIVVFIMLPLMLREAVVASCPEELLPLPLREVEQIPHLGHLRNKVVAVFIWAMVTFSPFIMYMQYDTFYGYSLDFVGLIYQLIYRAYSFLDFSLFVNVAIIPGSLIWVMLLMSSIRLLFVREIFRWFAGKSSLSRLVMIGVLGELLPSGIISSTYLLMGVTSTAGLYLPFPSVILAGLLSLKLFKFKLESATLWDEEGISLEGSATLEPARQTKKPLRPIHDDIIRVPVLYMVKSKIGSVSKRSKRHEAENSEGPEADDKAP